MTAKLLYIRPHVRRAPVDRYAAVKAAKTADLYEEVHGDHMTALLEEALAMAFAEDQEFAARTQEAW